MKDCDIMESFDRKFEKFRSKDSELEESGGGVLESFDRKFESFESKDSEHDSSSDRILKVSTGNFESFDTKDCENSEVSIGNFESFESKDLKIDGRTKPRSQKQIDTFKKNFSKSKSLELKIQELDLRMRHLQSLVLRLM